MAQFQGTSRIRSIFPRWSATCSIGGSANGIVEKYLHRNDGAQTTLLVPRRSDHGQQPDGRPPRLGPHLQGSLPALPRDARQGAALPERLRLPGSLGRGRGRERARPQEQARHRDLRHRRVRQNAARSASSNSRDAQTEQSIRLGYWMDWDNSLLHDVGREQLHHLALPEDLPRARLDLQGARRHALVPALRHRHLRARDRDRGLPGAHAPLGLRHVPAARSRPTQRCWSGRRPLDAGGQRRRGGPSGARPTSTSPSRTAGPTTSPRKRPRSRSAASTRSSRELKGSGPGRPALPRSVRRAAGRQTASSTASSPGTTSARPKAPASSTSRRAPARRTSRSRRRTTCR